LSLSLDRNALEAHQTLAVIGLYFDWDWAKAKCAFDEALRLDPSDASTYQWFSLWHLARDEDEEACTMSLRAEELDPNSLMAAAHSAWMLHYSGRLDVAIAKARSIIVRSPHFWRGYFNLALSLDAAGKPDEAVRAAEIAAALNEHTGLAAIRARALARAGEVSSARECLSRLDSSPEYVSPYWRAYAATGLGEVDLALNQLAESLTKREWFLLFLKHEPAFTALQTTSAFETVRRGVGLP
jgi:tetratricopeptide (TPR) repeat protein